jgi:hypothetical protein
MPRKKVPPAETPTPQLVEVHTRLFAEDVVELKRRAAQQGLPWQIELRLTIRRALKGERREVLVFTEGEKK